MALFNRRKNQTITELEEYYANRNNSPLRAWLMAFLSLLVTVGVLTAIFFGGRWVYRALTDNDEPTVVTTDTSERDQNEQSETGTTGSVGSEQQGQIDTDSDVEPEGVVSDQAASTNRPNNGTQQTAGASTTPTTGDDLPETGAGELIVAAPIMALVLGYFISRRQQLNKR